MNSDTFERDVFEEVQEGDYVLLKLNVPFLAKMIEEKQKMFEEAMAKSQPDKKVAQKPLPPAKVEISSFAIGKVNESLPSVLFLTDCLEEKAPEVSKKSFEFREIKSVRKITEAQYQDLRQSLVGKE